MTPKPNNPWSRTTLGKALPIKYGKARTEKAGVVCEESPVYGSSGVIGKFDRALTTGPALIIGRKGTVGATHYSAEPCWPIDTVYFTEASEDKDLRFFKYLLDHLQLGRMDRSTAVPGLSRDDYNAKEVAIPDIDEQQRIVAEIEKQFTRLDAGVASLRRVQIALKRYRASVLKAACEGEWESATLGSLSLQSSYGTSVKCSYQSPGIPVLRIPNIQHGRIDLTNLKFATSAVDLDDESTLKPNDFLIVRTNGSKDLIGRGAVVLSDFKRPHFFASYLIRFRIRDRDTAEWLSTVWNSENVRKQILTIAATSAGQYNVNQTNLSKTSTGRPIRNTILERLLARSQ
jgi:type I restriction enzyme S subunit